MQMPKVLLPFFHQEEKPSREDLKKYLKECRYGECATYTPDINELERHPRQLIFVMDDMSTGGKYHDYITETNVFGRWPGCSGYTEDLFTFWNRRLGNDSYPVALPPEFAVKENEPWREIPSPAPPARIWGQVYSIRPFQFKKLDFLRENGVQFKRERVQIRIPHQKTFQKPLPEVSHEMSHFMDCWMYKGVPEYFKDLIDNGFMFTPVRTVQYKGVRQRDWLDRYYLYSNAKRQDY